MLKQLNNEIFIYVLTFLDARCIIVVKRVCKRFDKIGDKDYIWGELIERKWKSTVSPKGNLKTFYLDMEFKLYNIMKEYKNDQVRIYELLKEERERQNKALCSKLKEKKRIKAALQVLNPDNEETKENSTN